MQGSTIRIFYNTKQYDIDVIDIKPATAGAISCQDTDLNVSSAPELTCGNRKSQFHEFAGELTSNVNPHYLSRSQWLQLPNLTARRRI